MSTDTKCSFKLSSVKQNRYGQHQYKEDVEGTVEFPPEGDFWTIVDPSEELCRAFSKERREDGFDVKRYGDSKFLMSRIASEKIPSGDDERPMGACCVVKIESPEGDCFVLVVDNKPYISPCCGSCESGETPYKTAIRELKEELAIDANEEELEPIGRWRFVEKNDLVNFVWVKETKAFCLKIDWQRASRLMVDERGSPCDPLAFYREDAYPYVKAIDADLYDFELDETRCVFFVPSQGLERAAAIVPLPRKKEDKKDTVQFHGHVRHLLYAMCGVPPDRFTDVSYLSEFEVFGVDGSATATSRTYYNPSITKENRKDGFTLLDETTV